MRKSEPGNLGLSHEGNVFENLGLTGLSWYHYLALLCALCYLFIESYYLFGRLGSHKSDLSLYYQVAAKIFEGRVPYRDFGLEYPVFALVPIVIPQIFNRFTGSTFEIYIFWFVIQNLMLGLAAGYLIFRTNVKEGKKAVYRYAALVIFSFPIFLFRFDPFPALLTSLTVFYVSRNPFISGVSLMVSVVAKLYAIVFLPVIAVFYVINRHYRSSLLFFTGAFCITVAVLFFLLGIKSDFAGDFFNYHLLRGIHLESLAGGLLLLFDKFGWTTLHVTRSYGAQHLVSPWSDHVLQIIGIITPLCFILMTIFLVWVFWGEKNSVNKISTQTLITALTAQILLFMLLNKVFSPQYMIWLLPLIPFCREKLFLIFTAALMLTIFIFPGQYHHLLTKHLFMIIILNLRNLLLIWLLISIIRDLLRLRQPNLSLSAD